MKPGYSEHQTGLAVDFQACPMADGVRDDSVDRLELSNPFSTLPEYKWLIDHANQYKISQTYENESWHWRFEL
jgi:LAS superfamily LD-carboxypeptidase LdcB